MTTSNKMSKKIIYIFLLFIIFVIVCIIYTKKMDNYYAKTTEIRRCDSVNIKVTNKLHLSGAYNFNDSLYILSSKMEEPTHLYVSKFFSNLELPFFLRKEANNDTLWLIDKNETYFLVFRKDRDADCN